MKPFQWWTKFRAFNKQVSDRILPTEFEGQTVYLASLALVMGFLNSVSLAQHVHLNLALASGEHEILAQH